LLVLVLVAILVVLNLRSLDTVASGRIKTALRDFFRQGELVDEVARVPVELQILTTEPGVGAEVETSNAAFDETIERTLKESIQNGELISFTFEDGNPFIVHATISSELDFTSDEPVFDVEAAEEALSDALGGHTGVVGRHHPIAGRFIMPTMIGIVTE
jgi:hypothetical protein